MEPPLKCGEHPILSAEVELDTDPEAFLDAMVLEMEMLPTDPTEAVIDAIALRSFANAGVEQTS